MLARLRQSHTTAAEVKTKGVRRADSADMQDFEEHNSVWNEWVDRQNPPVRACVQTPLWRPNILVEIMVTAAQ
jgi:enamine deaminase RidA (YjgF/YER057c/UK114 family)